jgi:hypothetical protein
MPEPLPYSPYYFVRLDEAGYCMSEGPLLLEDDNDAIAHARVMLDGATLVAVYRDGHKISTLAKLC